MRRFYQQLLRLRNELRLGRGALSERHVMSHGAAQAITIVSPDVAIALTFSDEPQELKFPLPSGQWQRRLASRDRCWDGPGDESSETIVSAGEASLTPAGAGALLFTRVG
jgi:hypothetical protein